MSREDIVATAAKADDGHSLVKELWMQDGVEISLPEDSLGGPAVDEASAAATAAGHSARGVWDASVVLSAWIPSDELLRVESTRCVDAMLPEGPSAASRKPSVNLDEGAALDKSLIGGSSTYASHEPTTRVPVQSPLETGFLPRLEADDARHAKSDGAGSFDWRDTSLRDLTLLEAIIRLHPDAPVARTAELRIAVLRLCLKVLEHCIQAGLTRTWSRRQRILAVLEVLLALVATPWKVPAAIDTPTSIASRGVPHPIGEEPRLSPAEASLWSQAPMIPAETVGTDAAASGAGSARPKRQASSTSSDAALAWWLAPPMHESAAAFNDAIASDLLKRFESHLTSKAPMPWLQPHGPEPSQKGMEDGPDAGAGRDGGESADDLDKGNSSAGRVNEWQVGRPHLTVSDPETAAATRTI